MGPSAALARRCRQCSDDGGPHAESTAVSSQQHSPEGACRCGLGRGRAAPAEARMKSAASASKARPAVVESRTATQSVREPEVSSPLWRARGLGSGLASCHWEAALTAREASQRKQAGKHAAWGQVLSLKPSRPGKLGRGWGSTVLRDPSPSARWSRPASRLTVESINDNDRRQVISAGRNPSDFDEVIFFELNGGS